MNGVGTRRAFGIEPDGGSPFQDVMPTGRAMANGYRPEVGKGFEADQPRYNPLNASHPQSSPLVDLKDPVQVHLLTETALVDSREWMILSQEEVDDLKKQCQSIMQRIEQTRANLAVQSKYRDATISMTKLYSPGKNRSLVSDDSDSDSDEMRKAAAEREACDQKCEELATELFTLEKRIMEPQRRLLQHTAGILQLTHRGPSKKNKNQGGTDGMGGNDVPGSPESMYTYERESVEMLPGPGGNMFDDRSLYLPMGQPFGAKKQEIPPKSTARKETMELREENERLRDANARLQQEIDQMRAASDALNSEHAALQRENSERLQSASNAARQVAEMNGRLRTIIVQFDPNKNDEYRGPPPLVGGDAGGSGSGSSGGLADQLEYMSAGLSTALQEQEAEMARQSETGGIFVQYESRIAALNSDFQRLVSASSPASVPPPPLISSAGTSAGLSAQVAWLEQALPAIEAGMGRAADAVNGRQTVEQVDSVLMGLWDIIQSGFADQQRQRLERKASRAQFGLVSDDDMSGDESPFGTNEQYSLQALSAKVQWLYAQLTKLRGQKSVLKRQIKQQRELNNKSDAEKDTEIRNQAAALQTTTAALQSKTVELAKSEQEAVAVQERLAKALLELRDAQTSLAQKGNQTAKATRNLEQEVSERTAKLAALEQQGTRLQAALTAAEGSVAGLTAQLRDVAAARDAAVASADKMAKDLKTKDHELEELNMMLIELKTEATIAKAELDGAYGSRSQRAKDMAAYAKSAENLELQTQLDRMKNELTGTLKEYEGLTKDTLAAEREKLDLENQLDEALEAKAALEAEVRATRDKLEAEVAALKEELDGERLKVGPAVAGGSTRAGASMLSEQFRATMKGERKKFQEELRNEQAQRRKLEEELRALRRAAGPGRSPLSPRAG